MSLILRLSVMPSLSVLSTARQLLNNDFTFDSISIRPKMTTLTPGVDYMTDFDSWLHIQVRFYE